MHFLQLKAAHWLQKLLYIKENLQSAKIFLHNSLLYDKIKAKHKHLFTKLCGQSVLKTSFDTPLKLSENKTITKKDRVKCIKLLKKELLTLPLH